MTLAPPAVSSQRRAVFWLVLFALLAVATGLRLRQITQPPLDFHVLRQYDYAILARGEYFADAAGISPRAKEVATVNASAMLRLEPRILPWVAVQAYRLAGGEQLWIPRVLSVLFWFLGGAGLYWLARRWDGDGAGLGALAVFLLIPYGILASRSFQPDPLMVALTIAASVLFWRHFEQPGWSRFFQAVIVSAAGVFVKPTCIFIISGVFMALEIQRLGFWRAVLNPRAALFGVISVLPVAVYYLILIWTTKDMGGQASLSFVPSLLGKGFYWRGWAEMLGRVCGFIPLIVALWATWREQNGGKRAFLIGGWVGYVLYGLVFNFHIHTHDYYSMLVLPVLALALGRVVAVAGARATDFLVSPVRAVVVGTATIAVAVGGFLAAKQLRHSGSLPAGTKNAVLTAGAWLGVSKKFLLFLQQRPAQFAAQVAVMKEIGETVGHSTRTLLYDSDGGRALRYHGELAGRDIMVHRMAIDGKRATDPEADAAAMIEGLMATVHPEYLVATDLHEFNIAQPALRAAVAKRYPILKETKDFVVFDLRHPLTAPAS